MGLQKTQSICLSLFLSGFFPLPIPLTSAMTVLTLRTDTLLCYYCPLQDKSKPCRNITTQCLPDEVCTSSRGHYGPVHVLSGQGCVKRALCGSHESMSRGGVRYKVSHTCCCRDTCNSAPRPDPSLKKKIFGMIKGTKNRVNVTITVVQEQPFDSCANYTSPLTAISSGQ